MLRAIALIVVSMVSYAARAQPKVDLDWRMHVSGDVLIIDYAITNRTDLALRIADANTARGQALDERVLVGMEKSFRRGVSARHRIAFVKGGWLPLAPDQPGGPAHLTTLAPNATRSWQVRVPLPLRSWLPVGEALPLSNATRDAVLLIEYFAPQKIVPAGCDARFIVGKQRSLPDSVTFAPLEKR
jgi:hypothetical protein